MSMTEKNEKKNTTTRSNDSFNFSFKSAPWYWAIGEDWFSAGGQCFKVF